MEMFWVKEFHSQEDVHLQLALTADKLGLKACKSCTVAKSEKSPRFAFSHAWLPVIDETQPGSAEKARKLLTG